MESLASYKPQSWLSWFLRGILIFGVLVLMSRLVDLQLIRGEYFRSLSEGNRIRRVPIIAPRGDILTRGGEVIAGSREVKKIVIFDENLGFTKVEDVGDVSDEETFTEWERIYPHKKTFGHISGYIGETNSDEVEKIMAECPDRGPRSLGGEVGRSGLEEEYDCLLTGIDGEELIEVDSVGNTLRVLGRREPVKGKDIITTIDNGLQEKIAQLMEGKKGSVIVTDTKGEILALYSSPSYDPNAFVSGDATDEVQNYLNDNDKPLFNRAIGGVFHPGSVFKPIVAMAALEEGAIDEDFRFNDTGVITIKSAYGEYSYRNWYFTQYGGTEGEIDLTRAITRSTDTFFYKVGELTGIGKLDNWAEKFGYNKATGIDLPGEITGLVPSPEWKLSYKGERWFLGNTYHFSIGQGDLAVTPLSENTAITAIANEGKLCQPHLIIKDGDNCKDLNLDSDNVELVKTGMIGACTSGGTGFPFFDFKEKSGGIDVACKTGTAENINDDPHAWFTAFAPSEDPEIVTTVLVENGGEGSSVAAPIAREIFNYWFKLTASSIDSG